MANNNVSVMQQRNGPLWPLGFVQVANNGTPVCIMTNVDPGNVNAPESQSNNLTSEYTTTARAIWFQGIKPANNNNGMINNTGNVYILLVPPANQGPGNKADPGVMVGTIPANGGAYPLPQSLSSDARFSPYRIFLDADVSGEGALVTLFQPQGQ